MNKKTLISIILLLAILLPTAAISQSYIPKAKGLPGPNLSSETGGEALSGSGKERVKSYIVESVAPHFTKVFTGFAALFSFLGLIVAGIMYIMAYGREEMLTKAKTVALWSTVGLLISHLSYAIVSIITQIKIA